MSTASKQPVLFDHKIRVGLLCSERVNQMTKTYNDIDAVAHLLEEKEKDLELAAKIGQTLLEQNRELQQRNEFLEEQLNLSDDQVLQLKVEMQRKVDLLHRIADAECESSLSPAITPNSERKGIDAEKIDGKVKCLEEENANLKLEASHLKKLTQGLEEKEQQLVTDCVLQLESANERIEVLHEELGFKSEECSTQQREVTRLLKEVVTRQTNERKAQFVSMGTLEEDGWDFWLRVYSDSTLRNEMIVEHQDEPYLSEILSDEKLKSTKVIIENLPRSCSNQDLKNLLEAKIGYAKVINIRIIGNRGFVTFYEGKDALASIDHFNGKMFRGGFLRVRPDEAKRGGWTKKGPIEDNNSQMASLGHDTSFSSAKSIQTHIHTDSGNFTGDEPSSLSPTSEPDSDRRLIGRSDSTISLNCDRRPICSHIECIEKLANLLSEYGPVKYNDQRITDFFLDKPSYIQLTYFCWPLAAFRTRNQLLRIVGGYLCLPKDEIVAIDLSSNDGLNYICRDTWEPIAPCQIWNNSDLAKYALAFLKHFGPSWLGDLPFTYLMYSLPCSWQRDAQDLANIIEREVPSVISIQDTLYLTSLPDHRQAAARAIRRGPI